MKNHRKTYLYSLFLAALCFAGISACSEPSESSSENTSVKNNSEPEQKVVEWPVVPGSESPMLCVWISRDASVKEMRQVKQIGVDYVAMGGPQVPWTEASLQEIIDRFEAEGLTIVDMMIGGMSNTIFGREGRDGEIEDIKNSL